MVGLPALTYDPYPCRVDVVGDPVGVLGVLINESHPGVHDRILVALLPVCIYRVGDVLDVLDSLEAREVELVVVPDILQDLLALVGVVAVTTAVAGTVEGVGSMGWRQCLQAVLWAQVW